VFTARQGGVGEEKAGVDSDGKSTDTCPWIGRLRVQYSGALLPPLNRCLVGPDAGLVAPMTASNGGAPKCAKALARTGTFCLTRRRWSSRTADKIKPPPSTLRLFSISAFTISQPSSFFHLCDSTPNTSPAHNFYLYARRKPYAPCATFHFERGASFDRWAILLSYPLPANRPKHGCHYPRAGQPSPYLLRWPRRTGRIMVFAHYHLWIHADSLVFFPRCSKKPLRLPLTR
jgi:hypothetical protein